MLGESVSSKHLESALATLSSSALQPGWACLEGINVPINQHRLSKVLDETVFTQVLAMAHSTCSHALAQSTSLPHAGEWFNGGAFINSGFVHSRMRIPLLPLVLAGHLRSQLSLPLP